MAYPAFLFRKAALKCLLKPWDCEQQQLSRGRPFHQNLQRLNPAIHRTAAIINIANVYGKSAETTIPNANAMQTGPFEP